jgi:chromosomal replication initiator protein
VNEVLVNGQVMTMPPLRPIHAIQKQVCKEFGVSRDELIGPSREARIVRARHIAMARCRAAGESFPKIGYYFGSRDHTSVLHGCKKVASAASPAP